MGKKQLQCLFVGQRSAIYAEVLAQLNHFNFNLQLHVKQTSTKSAQIALHLKKCRGACLIFVSDKLGVSIEALSDLVWRFSSDAIIVIVSHKSATTSLKTPFRNTQIVRLLVDSSFSNDRKDNKRKKSRVSLQNFVQYSLLKADFRVCKHLLGVSEKKCNWLVDSSKEAVAYISKELHLIANIAYLDLFRVESAEALQAVPVLDFIVENEHTLFKSFVKKQLLQHKISRTLILSMKKSNGEVFRAELHVIPSIYKGKKCLQIWIHPVSQDVFGKLKASTYLYAPKKHIKNNSDENPFEVLNTSSEKTDNKSETAPKKIRVSHVLHEMIKKEEAKLNVQKFIALEKGNSDKNERNFYVHLDVSPEQKKSINKQLLRLVGSTRLKEIENIFWNRVKVTNLFKKIKKKTSTRLFIRLSEASVANTVFIKWLKLEIQKLGSGASMLVFLMPFDSDKGQRNQFINLATSLTKHDCKIAIDDFWLSENTQQLLKLSKPDYIRLSSAWLTHIKNDSRRKAALIRLIRQFEAIGIKVITPCGSNHEMRKLFSSSGASFCQEKT